MSSHDDLESAKVRKKKGAASRELPRGMSPGGKKKRAPSSELPETSNDQSAKRAKKKKQRKEAPKTDENEKDACRDPNATISDRTKANFEKFMAEIFADGAEKIMKEYEKEVKPYHPPDLKRAVFDANKDRNRYKDIVCNDNTRVVLSDGKGGDYIHANYVKGEPLYNTFICTQGPTEKTVTDFVRMIMQEKVHNIFMICELMEGGKKKCERYWGENEGDVMTFGDTTITTMDMVEKDAHVVLTTLDFHSAERNKTRQVKHYQWKTWPDKSVPKSLLAAFRLLKNSRISRTPTVVHCSAGIGRTGTLVAVEMCLQRLYSDKEFKRIDVIKHLKNQRDHSVQTSHQYLYIFTALCEYARVMGMIDNRDELLNKYKEFHCEYEEILRKKSRDDERRPEPTGKYRE